jgi:hypothetical protein
MDTRAEGDSATLLVLSYAFGLKITIVSPDYANKKVRTLYDQVGISTIGFLYMRSVCHIYDRL